MVFRNATLNFCAFAVYGQGCAKHFFSFSSEYNFHFIIITRLGYTLQQGNLDKVNHFSVTSWTRLILISNILTWCRFVTKMDIYIWMHITWFYPFICVIKTDIEYNNVINSYFKICERFQDSKLKPNILKLGYFQIFILDQVVWFHSALGAVCLPRVASPYQVQT